MTEHPHQLYAIDFTEADQVRLAGFSCGDEAWSRHVAEWILGSDVLDSMSKWGTRVWLFETAQGAVVGFGSVGITRWRWPPPDGEPTKIVLLPMLGIDKRFHGMPADPEWRYSRQIMSHLVSEAERIAREWPDLDKKPRWLVLMVHRDNQRAIAFYEQCGFELIPDVVRRNDHLVMQFLLAE